MSQNSKQAAVNVEENEPTVGPGIVPIWLILFLGGLFYWGTNYLDGHAGGFNPQVFEPFDSVEEIANRQPYDPHGHKLMVGKGIFDKVCSVCHQANGMGKEGQFPPLAGSDWLLAPSPTRIARIVMNGLSGPITVKANGKIIQLYGTMPPPGDFDDEQIAAVLTYVRQQWGNNASEIMKEQVTAIRAASKDKHGAWSPDDLQKMSDTDAAK